MEIHKTYPDPLRFCRRALHDQKTGMMIPPEKISIRADRCVCDKSTHCQSEQAMVTLLQSP